MPILSLGGYGTRMGVNQPYHALQSTYSPYFQQQLSHFATQQPLFGTQQYTSYTAQTYGNPTNGQQSSLNNNSVSQPNLSYAAQPIFPYNNGTINSANATT
ncbi:14453_t:CDS:1 [Funneliformis geosporum]|uniref:19764_t:CDS:1 n=1 Tax=Funneliformis geosporum TaxID=1117311 RepID=A0A9W4STP1_9GLOM|nr:19764_t:CDS:1 [Funneliformis geosporum]CAI2181240.1 14453_t:CDS:1 [Funneliformis geosporum]